MLVKESSIYEGHAFVRTSKKKIKHLGELDSTPVASMSKAAAAAVGILLCSFPLVLNLQWKRLRCGPHIGTSQQETISLAISTTPTCASSSHLLPILSELTTPSSQYVSQKKRTIQH